jgi:colicin import membrane protein
MAGISSLATSILPGAIGFVQDVQQQQQQNAYVDAQRARAEQDAQIAYQQALQQREWELQRRALEEQYRQQELAQTQAQQQQQYQFALQQQQWELEQRAYDQRRSEWERNRLAYEQKDQLAGLIAQQDLAFTQAQAETQRRQAELAAGAEASESERRSALRRAVARQRVSFGASGIDATGGSGEAVLLGLINNSEDEASQRRRTDALREQALTQDLSNLRQQNLLERTRLAEAQKFQLLTFLG